MTIRAAAELVSVRSAIRGWLAEALDEADTDDVLLASGEALANALEHGAGPVALTMAWDGDTNLRVKVEDSGAWGSSSDDPTRGHGFPIMAALTENLRIGSTEGTSVELQHRFST